MGWQWWKYTATQTKELTICQQNRRFQQQKWWYQQPKFRISSIIFNNNLWCHGAHPHHHHHHHHHHQFSLSSDKKRTRHLIIYGAPLAVKKSCHLGSSTPQNNWDHLKSAGFSTHPIGLCIEEISAFGPLPAVDVKWSLSWNFHDLRVPTGINEASNLDVSQECTITARWLGDPVEANGSEAPRSKASGKTSKQAVKRPWNDQEIPRDEYWSTLN